MKAKLDELFTCYSNSNMTLSMLKESVVRLIDDKHQPPYDREAFRRDLIVEAFRKTNFGDFTYNEASKIINNQADSIIAEYERRQNEQR